MKYLFLAAFMALIFLGCFLIDRLAKALVRRHPQQQSGHAVRLPRKCAVFGVLLAFFPCAVLLGYWGDIRVYFRIACGLVALMGAFLLWQYFSFVVYYDEDSFVYRTPGRAAKTCRYGDISGQKSLLTRGGVNTTLYLVDGELNLFNAMEGAGDFLRFAFDRWCEIKGVDPDTVENNPELLTYFPEPSEKAD